MERAVHATVCYPEGLEKIRRERWSIVVRSHLVNKGYSVIRTEPVGVCDHRRSESETRLLGNGNCRHVGIVFYVFAILLLL